MTHAPALLTALRERLHRARAGVRDAGASALEFAIIAAIVVVAATLIGAAVYNVVDNKKKDLDSCANQPVGSVCAGGGGTAP